MFCYRDACMAKCSYTFPSFKFLLILVTRCRYVFSLCEKGGRIRTSHVHHASHHNQLKATKCVHAAILCCTCSMCTLYYYSRVEYTCILGFNSIHTDEPPKVITMFMRPCQHYWTAWIEATCLHFSLVPRPEKGKEAWWIWTQSSGAFTLLYDKV